MAMSFSRPDPSSPASIAEAGFSTGRRGFDQTEVREFLRMIAAELGRLQERERFLERELRTAQDSPDLSTAELDDAALTRLLGEETARVLTTARESATEIRQKAEMAAAQLLSEAGDEAARLREEAEIEASRRRSDAAADAEAELSMAKQQGREMVNEARAYRERVLSELARRRELAREQIEQLMHGRDRLMQSFERARLVAVDVVAELQPLGEPDEYVNLALTTGPVPVMVPKSARPATEPVPPSTVESLEPGEAAESAEAVEPAGSEPEAMGDTAPDPDEPVEGIERGAEPTEASDTADVEVATVERNDERDDVVVDLFARLRAEAVPIEPEPDTETERSDETAPADADIDADIDADSDAGTDRAEPSPFAQRDADLTPIIVAAARKLKRVLADEQNQALETLRRKEPVRDLGALVPSEDEHVARYADAIADDLGRAADAGAGTVGGPLRPADTEASTRAARDVLAEWLVAPLRERLERCVADGDGDNVGIGKRVRAVYREWKTQHIDEQLDDVVRAAHGRAVLAAVPAGSPVVWAADAEHRSCADCDDNTLAGAVTAGEPFPTGHTFAPAHIGCRCLLLPAGR